jgi:hypothetical protein
MAHHVIRFVFSVKAASTYRLWDLKRTHALSDRVIEDILSYVRLVHAPPEFCPDSVKSVHKKAKETMECMVRTVIRVYTACGLGIGAGNVLQVGPSLARVHRVGVDLSSLPFSPPRHETLQWFIRDPIGAAVSMLFDPRCSGTSTPSFYVSI